MRYFLVKEGSVVTDKQAFAGDDSKIDALINMFITKNPTAVVTEVNVAVFDATVLTPRVNQAQQAWATFKASGPSPLQAVIYLAKFLGLE